ncbi:hypothetical protein EUGRSUZ_A02715 [Eucalyptus grandis]|uniref:Uncharacterized protein n=2 Tax=Eucalyptus grandis TaxID=71139 RepID=A0ACC3M7H4_EUCGR|nr:hypothetical protein EUGRSUZ_A02715 [Eucalyptus grandis]
MQFSTSICCDRETRQQTPSLFALQVFQSLHFFVLKMSMRASKALTTNPFFVWPARFSEYILFRFKDEYEGL